MPEICRFYGIIIQMYFDDHAPPHFHARYGGDRAVFSIDAAAILRGQLPIRAHNMIVEWTRLHQQELIEAWGRAQEQEPPGKIAPLD